MLNQTLGIGSLFVQHCAACARAGPPAACPRWRTARFSTKPPSPPSVVPPIRKTRFDNLPPSSPPSPPEPEPPLAGDGGDPPEVGESGTHEYECTKCGYVIFPAKGREFKFFGASFECPQCGAGKDAFVDNGPVDD